VFGIRIETHRFEIPAPGPHGHDDGDRETELVPFETL
jgi:hypothetical protein